MASNSMGRIPSAHITAAGVTQSHVPRGDEFVTTRRRGTAFTCHIELNTQCLFWRSSTNRNYVYLTNRETTGPSATSKECTATVHGLMNHKSIRYY